MAQQVQKKDDQLNAAKREILEECGELTGKISQLQDLLVPPALKQRLQAIMAERTNDPKMIQKLDDEFPRHVKALLKGYREETGTECSDKVLERVLERAIEGVSTAFTHLQRSSRENRFQETYRAYLENEMPSDLRRQLVGFAKEFDRIEFKIANYKHYTVMFDRKIDEGVLYGHIVHAAFASQTFSALRELDSDGWVKNH